MNTSTLRTPSVLVERDTAVANIDRMQSVADSAGIRLRPHAKTHKSPRIANWQLERGAIGICCAKLGEAEVFAAAGVEDIRLPYPLNPVNASRVLALLDRTRLSFIVDHLEVARGWSRAMQEAKREVEILVKIDVGFHRCGIAPTVDTAVAFVREVAELPGLTFRGLLAHAGHGYHATSEEHVRTIAEEESETLRTLRAAIEGAGVQVLEVSAGATPTARYSLQQRGLTEFRPGNYVYFDRTQVGLGAATLDDCALTVLSTVVSKPAADRIILDAGSKTLAADGARGFTPLAGYGTIVGHPDLIVERLSEEHATVRAPGGTPLEPGHRVRIIPNHSCVVSNLTDRVWLVDGDDSVEEMPVAARGRNQ